MSLQDSLHLSELLRCLKMLEFCQYINAHALEWTNVGLSRQHKRNHIPQSHPAQLKNDNSNKFKELTNDPTICREGKLQRFLRNLKKNGKVDNDIYRTAKFILQGRSQHAYMVYPKCIKLNLLM